MKARHILYVDKRDKHASYWNNHIQIALMPEFTSDFCANFDLFADKIVDDNFKDNKKEKYSALITHLPYEPGYVTGAFSEFKGERFFEMAYETSARLVRGIKTKHPDLPILLYSGIWFPGVHDKETEMVEKFLEGLRISAHVFKSNDVTYDAMSIKSKLIKIVR